MVRQSGLSLVELITTLLIMAVLARVAIPSYNNVIRDNRLLGAANSLMGAIAMARAEAVRRGRMVSVCPSSTGTSCSSDWAAGWIVYVEATSVTTGGTPTLDTTVGTAGVLQAGEAMKKTVVTTTSTATGGPKPYVRFSSRGQSEQDITFAIKPSGTGACTSGKVYFRQLSIGIAGRPQLTSVVCP